MPQNDRSAIGVMYLHTLTTFSSSTLILTKPAPFSWTGAVIKLGWLRFLCSALEPSRISKESGHTFPVKLILRLIAVVNAFSIGPLLQQQGRTFC